MLKESRLHYKLGDRVITSFLNEQGTIKEITSLLYDYSIGFWKRNNFPKQQYPIRRSSHRKNNATTNRTEEKQHSIN